MAVFGIFGTETANVASSVYYGLYALQHRGQASCGIVVNDDGVFHAYKDSVAFLSACSDNDRLFGLFGKICRPAFYYLSVNDR